MSFTVLLNNNFSVVVTLYLAVCLNALPVTALHNHTRGQRSAARLRDLAFLQSISPEPVFGCNPVSIAVLVKARYLTDIKWQASLLWFG